ncbi:MAG: NAD(P)(+) transhydrogenase (Re/Si-specific) subunit beta [Oscillospiraceae bacterium]|jgi:NAD(P) transhydrogenase subunit beta|nr:NAD(P)(+) transhydrogenase (Re/Si-specific) subunit beta [Oscillospiraceae bacterium]
MSNAVYYAVCGVLVLGVLIGINGMSKVKSSVAGNSLSAVCTLLAILVTLYKYGVLSDLLLWLALAAGSVAGIVAAMRVRMIQMPQAVALLNGLGGAASALVAVVSLSGGLSGLFSLITAGLAMAVGMLTLIGSLVAAAKLHGKMNPRPQILPNHQGIISSAILATVAGIVCMGIFTDGVLLFVASAVCLVSSSLFGWYFAIRVGGADMPVAISLLNSFSGVAGSIAGMAISDPLLVAVGGVVGASGLLLTQVMCRAMNRSLSGVLLGSAASPAKTDSAPPAPAAAVAAPAAKADPLGDAAARLKNARRVIIVPGYGMAVAQAQSLVKQLSDRLEASGKEVEFAIHPVAGRMPGHMNVLLAEANVPYEQLRELDEINPAFTGCDAAIVIGANDVVNPAANSAEGTPIYGMPILEAEKAESVIVCNFDLKPGYAGVENPLYSMDKTSLLLGDAKDTLTSLMACMQG